MLGGEKEVVSCYEKDSLKAIESDILIGMKEVFMGSLGQLNDRSLKNYTIAMKG